MYRDPMPKDEDQRERADGKERTLEDCEQMFLDELMSVWTDVHFLRQHMPLPAVVRTLSTDALLKLHRGHVPIDDPSVEALCKELVSLEEYSCFSWHRSAT